MEHWAEIEFQSPLSLGACRQQLDGIVKTGIYLDQGASISIRSLKFSGVTPATIGFQMLVLGSRATSRLPNHAYLTLSGKLTDHQDGTNVRLVIEPGSPDKIEERLLYLGWDLIIFTPVIVFLYRAYQTPTMENILSIGVIILLPILNYLLFRWNLRPGRSLIAEIARRALTQDEAGEMRADNRPPEWVDSFPDNR